MRMPRVKTDLYLSRSGRQHLNSHSPVTGLSRPPAGLRLLLSLAAVLMLLPPLFGQPDTDMLKHIYPYMDREVQGDLNRISGINDKAVGVLDKGQLAVNTSNFGELANFLVWFTNAGHWPRTADGSRQYFFGLGLLVGISEENVIETSTQFMTKLQDWVPPDGVQGREFSGDVRAASDDTPFMATSDFPDTWPAGFWDGGSWMEDGGRHWPGRFRINTAHPGYPAVLEEVEGEFASDRDIYCSYSDDLNPKGSAGILVEQTGYSYGRNYAEDIIFFHLRISNTSPADHDSVYIGLYSRFRPDYDNRDYLDFIDRDGDGKKDLQIIYDVNNRANMNWQSTEARDPLGMVGLRIYDTPFDMGITDFHHFPNSIRPINDEQFWAIMSSDRNSSAFDSDTTLQLYFHGQDRRIDDCSPDSLNSYYPPVYLADADEDIPGDAINSILSVGPFTLAADSSVELSFALIMGDAGSTPYRPDFSDLLRNVDQADEMAENMFQGPVPPPAPVLHAVEEEGAVTLYWAADPSETRADPSLRKIDFEGYKIYRSEDRGMTWGKAVTDAYGQTSGYVPLAIFDRINGITGEDPVFRQLLGEDSGIRHSYRDENLINGREYWYCVTAYDSGNQDPDSLLQSYMVPIGTSLLESHTVSAIPGARVSNYIPGEVPSGDLTPRTGSSSAHVRLELLDPDLITGHSYEFSFNDGNPVTFNLYDLDSGDSLLVRQGLSDESEDNITAVHGFRPVIIDTSSQPLSSQVSYVFQTQAGSLTANSANTLSGVKVVPDPYFVSNTYESSEYGKKLKFNHLPDRCSIRIFTLSGDYVDSFEHDSNRGYSFWDMRTKNDQFLAPGIYLYHIETPDGQSTAGRFLVIR